MPKCLNCGHIFKSRNSNKYVKSCSKCTMLFNINEIDNLIKDMMDF